MLKLSCLLTLVLVISSHVVSAEQKYIPQITEGPYQHYSGRLLVELGGRQYFFDTTNAATWTEAKNFCRSIGMFLVSIETPEENQLIVDFITSTAGASDYWTSANDIGRPQGDYIWDSTGQRVIYTDFHAGEPNFGRDEHYLEIQYKNEQLKWNDEEVGASPTYAICEQA